MTQNRVTFLESMLCLQDKGDADPLIKFYMSFLLFYVSLLKKGVIGHGWSNMAVADR